LLESCKEVNLEVNIEKTKCVFVFHHWNAGQNHNLVIVNKSTANVAKFKYLRMPLTNQNCVCGKIQNRLSVVYACCHSVQHFWSLCLLSENLKIKT